MAHEALKWYDENADHPPWIKALADVRRQATLEGYCYPHVQAIIVAIDQYAEAALGNRDYFLNRAIPDWLKLVEAMINPRTAALLTLLVLWSPALASDLIGHASVIDGDTLEIHGTRIRLWGIDAPESTQLCRGEDSLQYRCGAQAANDLDAFIAQRPVNCVPMNPDQYGRTVATCSACGADLGEWLVRSGLALDWPQFSKGRYDAAQRDAERIGRGIWKGSYVEPWLYRACIRANGNPPNCSDDATAHP